MSRAFAAVLVVLLSACVASPPDASTPAAAEGCAGGKCDGSEPAASAGDALPLEALPSRLARTICSHARVCNVTDARLSILTEDECRDEQAATFAHRLRLLAPSLRAARIVYEPARALARLAEIDANVAAGRCLVDNTIRESDVFRGTVAPGSSCWQDECASGTICVPASGFECGGTCTAVPAAAPTGACTGDHECLPEQGCEEGTCRALSAVGAGESCHRSAQCPTGLYCQPAPSGGGRCEPPRADGEPCDATTICGRGRTCRLQEDGSHLCGLAPGRSEVCDGILVFCRQLGLVCDWAEEGVSRCRPEGQEGDACTGGDCAPGLRCDRGEDGNTYPGVCRPARANGEPCRDAEDCLGDWCGPGNVCVGQFGSLGCAAAAPAG